MADFVIRVGSRTAQGSRPNNEDTYVVDQEHNVFLVADGMGGQELGERASSMAAEIIPRAVQSRLAANEDASQAVAHALADANEAIV
jgi:serine/threonine protein phosphatase PrpC